MSRQVMEIKVPWTTRLARNFWGDVVPAVPLAEWPDATLRKPWTWWKVWARRVCPSCGERFRRGVDYRGHYALRHILGLR